jgi:mono/diheme cytochrome c family protein
MSTGRCLVPGLLIAALIRGASAAPTSAAPTSAVPTDATAPIEQPALDGQVLYKQRCGVCHMQGGTGTFMLERRLGKAQALLDERTDLAAPYVSTVARQGIMSMPRFTRTELTDAELAAIAAYLSRPR